MTDEQIKQNAKQYAHYHQNALMYSDGDDKVLYDAYIAGAHSRDKEIEELKNEAIAIMDEACALKTKLDKLRNP